MPRCIARGSRILLILLSVTGCAVEPPRPVLVPPPATPAALVPPPIVSAFGAWRGEGGTASTSRHAGIDIRAMTGTSVLAAADGLVLRAGFQAYAGRLIVIGHESDLATVYYHLSVVEVSTGQTVRRGEVIGRVGTTGNATAPHLHFGVCRREGGFCSERIEDGWEDPARRWVAPNPCFVPGRYTGEPTRLSFPVPCQPGPAVNRSLERPPGTAERPPGAARGARRGFGPA